MGKDQQYYERRQAGVIRKRRRSRLDALLLTQAADIRYLCGFTGSSAVLVFARQGPAFFTDGRYTQQAGEEVAGIQTVGSGRNPFLRALPGVQEGTLSTIS